jgi:FixJ family two-component response regulator
VQSAEKATEDTVLIVEDDKAFSAALHRLFRTVGLRVEVFESAAALLKCPLPEVPSCLVLDVRLPLLSGFDIQAELAKAGVQIPTIFMTGYGDIPMSVKARADASPHSRHRPARQAALAQLLA